MIYRKTFRIDALEAALALVPAPTPTLELLGLPTLPSPGFAGSEGAGTSGSNLIAPNFVSPPMDLSGPIRLTPAPVAVPHLELQNSHARIREYAARDARAAPVAQEWVQHLHLEVADR